MKTARPCAQCLQPRLLASRGAGRAPGPLFSDAEGGEDAVQDVVGGGGAGDGVDRAQRGVEIEQQHLVRDAGLAPPPRAFSRYAARFAQQLLVAQAGDEAGLLLERALGRDRFQDRLAQLAGCPRRSARRPRDRRPGSARRAADRTCCRPPGSGPAPRARSISAAVLVVQRLRRGRPPPASGRHPPWPGSCARCPAISTRPAASRMPAVSKSLTGMPPIAAVSETRSRVVPGMSVTMARSCSSRRLNRLLLPTLGRPTMASVSPARTSPPYWKLAASCADAVADRRPGGAGSRRRARR